VDICYKIPEGVIEIATKHHPVLSTKQGGGVTLDRHMLTLWRSAGENELNELIKEFEIKGFSEVEVRAGLLCLTQAGLLSRQGENEDELEHRFVEGELVSIVIVSYNSLKWLEACISSILSQTYSPLEVIIVDNASTDGSPDWIIAHFPDVKIVRLKNKTSLSGAINLGVEKAAGNYFLVLNPDVELEPNVIALMINAVEDDSMCAAVTAKLKFLWAPAFLNGLGNFVGGYSWGTDIAIGHLDMGQFDDVRQVPSACFAGTLISAGVWETVGPLDEGFSLYYEDSEWCYRARLFGYQVKIVTQGIIYHAFGGRVPSADYTMGASKYHQVVYGRLRFISKLLHWKSWLRFIIAYSFEDCIRFIIALFRGRFKVTNAYFLGWIDFVRDFSEIKHSRKVIQQKRVITDRDLFRTQHWVPAPLIWHGLPILTRDTVRNEYLPRIISAKIGEFPEFIDFDMDSFSDATKKEHYLRRGIGILQGEGLDRFLHRVWKYIQWRMMKV
jgi:GT2 family glycosyltransferase